MRLFTLFPSLYANRNALRLAHIQPELNIINDRMRRARKDKKMPIAERKVIIQSAKRQRSVLFKKHKCSQRRAFIQMLTIPVVSSAFVAIQNMVSYNDELESETFLWLTDLTMPDTTYGVQLACVSMFMLNFELNQALNRGGRSPSQLFLLWGMRLATCAMVYFSANQPSAVFLYWMGMSLCGFAQPMLLRWHPFRTFFKYPDPPETVTKHRKKDWLMIFLGYWNQSLVDKPDTRPLKTVHDVQVVFDSDIKTKR